MVWRWLGLLASDAGHWLWWFLFVLRRSLVRVLPLCALLLFLLEHDLVIYPL